VREIAAAAIEDVFGFEVPEGLKLEPFAKVVAELSSLQQMINSGLNLGTGVPRTIVE